MVRRRPRLSNDTKPPSMFGVYDGGGLAWAGLGKVGNAAPPSALIKSPMPVPVTNDPVKVRLFPRLSSSFAGITGSNASNDTPQAVAWLEVWVGGGVKASTLYCRTTLETCKNRGSAELPELAVVVIMPRHWL